MDYGNYYSMKYKLSKALLQKLVDRKDSLNIKEGYIFYLVDILKNIINPQSFYSLWIYLYCNLTFLGLLLEKDRKFSTLESQEKFPKRK